MISWGKSQPPHSPPATPRDLPHPCWSFPEAGDELGLWVRGERTQRPVMLEGICCPLDSSVLSLVKGTRPASERAPAWGIHIWAATHLASDLAEVQTHQASSGLPIAFSAVTLRFSCHSPQPQGQEGRFTFGLLEGTEKISCSWDWEVQTLRKNTGLHTAPADWWSLCSRYSCEWRHL